MKKVMVFGTFDIVHPGHIYFFEKSKEFGDQLIVVVALDMNVKNEKGSFPHNNERKRVNEVKRLSIVDEAVLGNKDDKYKIIEEHKPDMICLGYDQQEDADKLVDEMLKRGINLSVVRLDPYKPEKYKSSKMR
jgi:FAD synthetase